MGKDRNCCSGPEGAYRPSDRPEAFYPSGVDDPFHRICTVYFILDMAVLFLIMVKKSEEVRLCAEAVPYCCFSC